MKKMLLAISILAGGMATEAQSRIGVKGGLNFSNQYRKDAGYGKYDTKFHSELQAGLIGDISLGGNLYLQPQFLYSRKGGTHDSKLAGQDVKLKMNYFEMPVNLVVKRHMGMVNLFVGGGPVIGYGFGGELIQNGVTKKLFSEDVKNFRREDISANLTAGIELWNGLFGSISYQKGFRDIYKTEDITIRNSSISVSVGYYLNNKKRNKK